MPIVPYKLDVGFRFPAVTPPPTPAEKVRGGGLFQFGENWKYMQEDFAEMGETFGAAFELENAVLNTWEFLSKPTFAPVEGFDLEANLRAANMWEDFRWNYIGVQSPGEFLYKTRQILKEKRAREIVSAAGPDGIAAMIVAGVVSPTVLLPFVGAGQGVARGLASGLAWGLAAGVLDEVPLQLNQELRTLEESGTAVGFSTLIGGILGGGVGHLNKRLARVSDDMGIVPGTKYVSPSEERVLIERRLAELDKAGKSAGPEEDLTPLIDEALVLERRLDEVRLNEGHATRGAELDEAIASSALGRRSAAGADVPDVNAGGLKNMFGIGERLRVLGGPATAALGQRVSEYGRWMGAQISTAGLRMERNLVLDQNGEIIGQVPSNIGGTIEDRVVSRARGDTLILRDMANRKWEDYFFGAKVSLGPFRGQRAGIARFLGGAATGKMNRSEFATEVSLAIWRGGKSDVPEAQAVAEQYMKYMAGLLEEAQELGIIPKEIKAVTPDLGYLSRIFDVKEIEQRPVEFMDDLAEHFESVVTNELSTLHERFLKADSADQARLADFDLPLEEAQKIRAAALDELKVLNKAEDDPAALDQLISDQRSLLRENTRQRKVLEGQLELLTRVADRAPLQAQIDRLALDREAIRERIGEIQELGGSDLEARLSRKRELKARIRNLNRSRYMVEEKARAKYDKMEELEEQNIETLERVVAQGSRILRQGDKDDAAFGKELAGLQAAVNKAGAAMTKFEGQIEQLEAARQVKGIAQNAPVDPADEINRKLFGKDVALSRAKERFNELFDDLASFENINWVERGRADAQAAVQDTLTAALERLNAQLEKKFARIAKLEKQAEKMDTAAVAKKRQEIVDRIRERKEATREKARLIGDDNFDLATGVGNVKQRAREIAELVRTHVTGLNVRLPSIDAIQGARGAEVARTLSMSSLALAKKGWLVTDSDQLMRIYANTLVADIEITKKLGLLAPDGERNISFQRLNEERFMKERQLTEQLRKEGKTEEQIKKEMDKLRYEYKELKNNLIAMLQRIRGQWGLPTNPDGIMERGAKLVSLWQASIFLGTVGLSSIPDVSRPMVKYGVGRTLRDAWVPLITNLKAVKMFAGEIRRAYVAVESAAAQNAYQLGELTDLARRETKFEAGMKFTASKIGIAFLFAPWTDLMKTLSSMTMNMKLLDSIDLALNKTGSSAERKEAIEFLNSLGLGPDLQRRIWDEMQNGGAEKVTSRLDKKGVWVPQTERWTDVEAKRAYRAALYHEASSSITTPGVELPKIADSNTAWRLFFRLKSFALASTSKTLMAALQQHDAAVLGRVTIGIALGALSYYLRAVAAGGQAEQRMREATWEQWIDEALDASGLFGVLSVGQRISQDIPYLRNLTSVGGISGLVQGKAPQQTIRSSSAGLIEDVAGPTADMIFTLTQLITGVDNPTRAQVHRVRQLLPMQNVFYLRRLFDQLENAVGDKFGLRGKRR